MDSNINEESHIVVFPEVEKLQKEVEKLRTEVSMAVQERDTLIFHECRNIENAYMIKFGTFESKALEAETTARKLRRKLEIIIAKRNRQEKIILSEIDIQLEEEFIEYERQKEEMYRKIVESLKYAEKEHLTEKETAELKKLYRKVVKELHPDLHPDISEAKIELFRKAVEAYDNGDLAEMKIIANMINCDLPEEKTDTLKVLKDLAETLKTKLKDVLAEIEKVKDCYPYNLSKVLNSEEESKKRMDELSHDIKFYTEAAQQYSKEIDEYIRGVIYL